MALILGCWPLRLKLYEACLTGEICEIGVGQQDNTTVLRSEPCRWDQARYYRRVHPTLHGVPLPDVPCVYIKRIRKNEYNNTHHEAYQAAKRRPLVRPVPSMRRYQPLNPAWWLPVAATCR
ncbi:hypothetical protein BJX96DRAFT_25358 [Aspergillus floccosus]